MAGGKRMKGFNMLMKSPLQLGAVTESKQLLQLLFNTLCISYPQTGSAIFITNYFKNGRSTMSSTYNNI